MRLIHVRPRKIDVIGRNQRQRLGIGDFNKTTLSQTFCLRGSAVRRVALQLYIKAVAVNRVEFVDERLRLGSLTCLQQPPEWRTLFWSDRWLRLAAKILAPLLDHYAMWQAR